MNRMSSAVCHAFPVQAVAPIDLLTRHEVEAYFCKYGAIVLVECHERGHGFVRFADVESVEKVLRDGS